MDKNKDYFWKLLNLTLAVGIIGLVFFVLPAISRYSNSLPRTSTMNVSASGKTFVSPDTAEANFSVVSRGRNPEELTENNDSKMSAVIENLKGKGVEAKDIKTTEYSLRPDYAYDENTRRSYITGYTMTQTVTVKIRDLTRVASVLSELTPLGVNQIGNVRFTLENKDAALQVARDEAIAKAKTKAKEMAASAGVRLGKLINVYEYQEGPIPYYGAREAMGLGGAVSVPSVEPGQQEITVQASLTYELK